MPGKSVTNAQLMAVVQSLQEEVRRLSARVEALEGAAVPPERTGTVAALPEDLLLTISAAVAAYLGVDSRIRQIRLLSGSSWAQQGRATIQASHSIRVHQH